MRLTLQKIADMYGARSHKGHIIFNDGSGYANLTNSKQTPWKLFYPIDSWMIYTRHAIDMDDNTVSIDFVGDDVSSVSLEVLVLCVEGI